MDRQTAINSFLQRYAEDWDAGEVLSHEQYREMFAGHEATVDEQLALIAGEGKAAESGASADSAVSWGLRDREKSEGSTEATDFGPYRLLSELGRGGQGEVWLAEDERIGRKVALKTLTMVGRLSKKGFERLQLEARVSSRLDHPGICTVYEADQIDGIPFVAMQHVDGPSLSALIRRARDEGSTEGPLRLPAERREDVTALVAFFETAALALHHAHDRGVLHRDVKPGNILVNPEGQPVLLDFGLAHDLMAQDDSISEGISGTPAYLAPERLAIAAPPTDARVDIYGLGVSLYEALTLRRPFEGATRENLFRAILDLEARDPRRHNPLISRDLAVVIETAMAKEPDRRYDSAADLAADLAAARERRPIVARRPSPLQRARLWAGRHPRTALLSVLLALASVVSAGLGGYLTARWPELSAGRAAVVADRRRALIEDGFGELGELRRDGARAAFEAALAEDPGDVLARVGMVLAALSERAPVEAQAALDAHPDPFSVELRRVQAEVLRWSGDDDAADLLQAGLPAPTTGRDHFVLGTLELFRGHQGRAASFAPAAEHLSQSLLWPEEAHAYHYVSLADALTHLPPDVWAQRLAATMVDGWPQHGEVQLLAGLTLQDEDLPAALAAYERALKLNPALGTAAVNIATLVGDEESLERARAACSSNPDRARLARLEARHARQHGQGERAIELLRGAVAFFPMADTYSAELLGLVRDELGGDAALAEARRLLAEEPRAARPRMWIAQVMLDRGAVDVARAEVEQVRAGTPWNGQAHHTLGTLHAAEGAFDRAVADFERALECRPSPITTQALLAARLDAGDLDGLADEARALAQPGEARTLRLAAVADIAAGFLRDGVPAYSAEVPATVEQLEAAARALELQGRAAEAELAWVRFARAGVAPATSAGSAWWRAARAGVIAAGEDAQLVARPLSILEGELNGTSKAWRDGRAGDRLFGELLRRYQVEPALDPWRDQPEGTPWGDLFARVEALCEEVEAQARTR